MNAPWPPLRRSCGFIGARQVSWLAAYRRRCLPGPAKAQWQKSVGTPLTVAGAATDRRRHLPCSLFTLDRDRGTVLGLCPSFERGCQMELEALSRATTPESPVRHRSKDTSGRFPNIERRLACTSAGSSSNGLGGEPRSPNQFLSSHNAVILAPATMAFRAGRPFSASAERPSAPNSVSANRRSISCCSTARAPFVVAHDEPGGAKAQCLALILMRLDARTTPGAQMATEARPRRN
jgi:hypothetical protein